MSDQTLNDRLQKWYENIARDLTDEQATEGFVVLTDLINRNKRFALKIVKRNEEFEATLREQTSIVRREAYINGWDDCHAPSTVAQTAEEAYEHRYGSSSVSE